MHRRPMLSSMNKPQQGEKEKENAIGEIIQTDQQIQGDIKKNL